MKLTDLQRDELREALLELQANGPGDKAFGICWNLQQIVAEGCGVDAYEFVSTNAAYWPGCRGDVCTEGGVQACSYPIPLGKYGDRKPLWEGAQLLARMSLIQYLLDTLGA